MSAGCAIVGSDVEPVREIADKAPNCMRLADMRDRRALADAINETLENRSATAQMRQAARELMLKDYAARDLYAAKAEWLAGL